MSLHPAIDVYCRAIKDARYHAYALLDTYASHDKLVAHVRALSVQARRQGHLDLVKDIENRMAQADEHLPGYQPSQFAADQAVLLGVLEHARVVVLPAMFDAEGDKLRERAASMVGTPENLFEQLPFSATLFLYDISMTEGLAQSDGHAYLAGLLLTDTGLLWEMYTSPPTSNQDKPWVAAVFLADEEGVDAVLGIPAMWLAWAHIKAMQAHGGPLLPTRQSLANRRASAQAGVTPRPYYEVRVGGALVRRVLDERFEHDRHWAHRWDVRRHRRLLVRRGPGVLDNDARYNVEQRHYRVYQHGDDNEEVLEGFRERGFPPPRDGEWVIYRWVLVREYVKGPEEAPYVPSVRVVAKT